MEIEHNQLRKEFQPPRDLPRIVKINVIVVLGLITTLYAAFSPQTNEEYCLTDQLHQLTLSLNREISCCAWRIVLGMAQVLMDFWIAFIVIFWILVPKNIRLPSAMALTFILRTIFLALIKFPYPTYIVWRNPGFMSLTVPYDHTRDFFFSGHTTSIVIILSEIILCRQSKYLIVFCFLTTVFMMATLIIVRIHYTIDVVAAVIFSLFIYGMVWKYLPWVDWAWSLPFQMFKKIQNKICGSNEPEHTSLVEEEI